MAGARPIFIRVIILVVFLLAVWLFAGRQISMLLDLAFTAQHATLPVSSLRINMGTFWFGELPLGVSDGDEAHLPVSVRADDSGHLVLSMEGKSITLGAIKSAKGKSDFPEGELAPDPGDEVTLTIRRSFMSWPTPFQMNFVSGHAPAWKRHFYYHLRWKKRSGAQVEMVWRYEQWYYSALGWPDGMMTGPGTGMIRCKIDATREK